MLERLVKHSRTALLLLAIWLAFEACISWAAFCEKADEYNAAHNAAREIACILRGPLVSILRVITSWWRHTFDEPDSYVALFTGVLVLATVALWWSTRKLWQVTNSTLKHAKTTAEQQLRAYLMIDTAMISDVEVGKRPSAELQIKNFGQTPAYDIRSRIGIAVVDYPPAVGPDDAPPKEILEGLAGSELSIGPQGTHKIATPLKRPLTNEQMAALTNGSKTIHVVGQIVYRDAFGESRRTTVSAFHGGPYGIRAGGGLSPGETGNKAT